MPKAISNIPAIIVMNHHRQRGERLIRRRLQTICTPIFSELVLSALEDDKNVSQEYYNHEAGHSLGLGIDLKERLNLLATPQQAGWEEIKTDWGGFRLSQEHFTPDEVGQLIACTFCIRWGIDFVRPGAPTNDHDAMAALLLLDRLLESGEVELTSDRLLALRNPSFEGLFDATKIHRKEAEELVAKELACLENPASIMDFYESRTASPTTIALHKEFIARCRDIG